MTDTPKPTTELQLTSEQEKALSTRNTSIALTAGAGCGKTFVLTHRFLSYLDPASGETVRQNNPLQKTVAITFTDRAAREMRDRIRAACMKQVAQASSPKLIEYWQQILRGLDMARISTIHSFCTGILKSHAAELGLDPNFRLMESTETTATIRAIVEKTLHDRLAKQDDVVMRVVGAFELEATTNSLRELLNQRYRLKIDQFDDLPDEELIERWKKLYFEEYIPQRLHDFVESHAFQVLKTLLRDHQPTKKKNQEGCRSLQQVMTVLETSVSTGEFEFDWPSQLSLIKENAVVKNTGGKTAWDDEDIYSQIKDAMETLRGEIKKRLVDAEVSDADFLTAVSFSRDFWDLLNSVWSAYDSFKQSAGVLDFEDLLVQTRDLLAQNEAARARLVRSIDFLLIDEFQDTDPIQTEIVRLLCNENLESEKLFLVGDIKQSIYRFRRADPTIFLQLRSEIPEAGRLPLLTNFRSRAEIIHFANGLFADEFQSDEAPLVPHRPKDSDLPPRIEFLFPQNDDPHDTNVGQLRKMEADWIASRINQCLQDDTVFVPDKSSPESSFRRVAPGDIVILFRAMSNVAIYEDALRRHGIDYYLVGGRAFYAQQEVFDLINLCRSIDEPDDDVSLIGLLRSPFFSLNDESIFLLSKDNLPISKALFRDRFEELDARQAEQTRFAADVISELRSLKDDISLFELLSRAIDRTGYDAALLMEYLGERKLANLRKILEMARQFDASHLRHMSEFVEELQDAINENADEELAATSPEAGNTVRLMTIHQSKGLEFPVVFVADMNRRKNNQSSSNRLHPELGPLVSLPDFGGESRANPGMIVDRYFESLADEEESIRLLYVALTRAADLLILSAGLAASGKLENSWMQLLGRKFDLLTGLPKTDPLLGRFTLGNLATDDIPAIRVHPTQPEFEKQERKSVSSVKLSELENKVLATVSKPFGPLAETISASTSKETALTVSQIERLSHEQHPPSPDSRVPTRSREDDIDSASRFGTLVHHVIETLDFTRAPFDEEWLADLVARSAKKLREKPSSRETALAIQMIDEFSRHPVAAELIEASQVLREVDFLLKYGDASQMHEDVTVVGTVDCLFCDQQNCWHLLDYKTGSVQGTEAAVLDHYGVQLALYALAIQSLTGELPASTRIVLLRSPIETVSIHWTPALIEEFRHRISSAVRELHSRQLSEVLASEEAGQGDFE